MLALLLALSATLPARAGRCPGPPLEMVELAAGVWLLPAAAGEAGESNRGQVVNLLLVRDGRRLWAVGAGPTPAFGRRLRCAAKLRTGLAPTDVLVTHARAELALGLAGLAPARGWAHEQVAAAMREQCPRCESLLRQRLGGAAGDLGRHPVRMPQRLLHGPSGRVGPFDWQVLPRAEGRVATALVLRRADLAVAQGLLWGDGPPDGRDTDLARLAGSLGGLATGFAAAGRPLRWVGETGAPLDSGAPARQAAYLRELVAAAAAAVEAGALDRPPPPLDGADHPRHALNWQRAWRQAEDRLLGAPPR